MSNGYLRYYKPSVLIGLLAFLGIAIYFAKDYLHLSVSIVSIISLILLAIDFWLWKTLLFSWMFWVDDFSGRYEGFLEYEYRDEYCNVKKGKLSHVKIIHQSGSKITIFSFTKYDDKKASSLSENIGMYVEKMNGEKHYQLTYTYLNNGNGDLKYPHHSGTDVIKFIRKGKEKQLSGRYYTERVPFSTRGKYLELNWVSNDQTHDF